MEILLYIAIALVSLAIAAILWVPPAVSYDETIIVNAPIKRIYNNIRMQEDLMAWSAWPEETGSTCAVEGTDGAIGAQTVYFTNGERSGFQEIIDLQQDHSVALKLADFGPIPQTPVLTFHLQKLDANQTEVKLHFDNQFKRPFQVLAKLLGMPKWVHSMHLKDLAGLKTYAERQNDTPSF